MVSVFYNLAKQTVGFGAVFRTCYESGRPHSVSTSEPTTVLLLGQPDSRRAGDCSDLADELHATDTKERCFWTVVRNKKRQNSTASTSRTRVAQPATGEFEIAKQAAS
jgi:hypothetical protein